jgi:SNF2 family DNA or RNA helicase
MAMCSLQKIRTSDIEVVAVESVAHVCLPELKQGGRVESKPMWAHQIKAVQQSLIHRDYALLCEQGTGKSRAMIEILRRKFAYSERVMRTLIIAPAIVHTNWKREFKEFSKIPQEDIIILNGTGKQRLEQLVRSLHAKSNRLIIMNYETTQMQAIMDILIEWAPEILVCDESQRLKNPESKRAKQVVRIADLTLHNYILTGTPILNSAMDVFMQYRILDRGLTFGKNFFAFRGSYFIDANASFKNKQTYFPKWEENPLTYEQLHNRIMSKSLRVTKAECLDLPPLVRQQAYTSLTPEQAKAYAEMYNYYITWIKSQDGTDKAVVANMAITKALRLQQIVTGFVTTEGGQVTRIPNKRMDDLAEVLEGIGHAKVIIWAVFKENYKMIAEVCTSLGLTYRELHGDVPQKQREINLDEFRKDPNVNVLIANQGAGGVGINLIEASYSVYFSKGFKLEDDLQSEARNHRGGSEMHSKITRIDLVCPGTIDELINEALSNKQQISNQILHWTEAMNNRR